MASVWPAKNNYATGDVLTAANMNGVGDDLNDVYSYSFTNNFFAGKNKIINGDFLINQRSFSSTTTNATYGFDRFKLNCSGGTATYSAQTFTAGAAPVSGYEGKNFAQLVTASQSAVGDYAAIVQPIEDVRVLAGQSATISFWAKASTGTPKVGIAWEQSFGSGGSSAVVTNAGNVTISTSWARYSVTVSVPSVSGKTISSANDTYSNVYLFTSAGSSLSSYTAIGIQNATIGIWGVQVEAGSTATPFQTATGTKQGELAACQRYYWRNTPATSFGNYGIGTAGATTTAFISIPLPVQMRIIPSSIDVPSTVTKLKLTNISATNWTISAIGTTDGTANNLMLQITTTGLTVNQSVVLGNNNDTSGFIGASAEL